MDSSKLLITFYKHFEKEYFDVPKNTYLNFQPFDYRQKYGAYLETMFDKKDQICYIKLKKNNLWLHEKNNKLIFSKISCIDNGFAKQHPLEIWIEYTIEPSFVLYKIDIIGLSKKKYINYKEINGKIYIRFVEKQILATPFLYNPIQWYEAQPDLVASKKRF